MTQDRAIEPHGLSTIFRRAALTLPVAVTAAAFFATSVMAETQCQQIKAEISKNGSYIYHYKDPAQPTLDLYHRLVSSNAQCNAGSLADDAKIEALAGCDVQRCYRTWGDGEVR